MSAEVITIGGQKLILSTWEDITERAKLDRAKDEFISLVSHELRTPLTVMLGSLKTAVSPGMTADDVSALIDNAIEGGESMETIINNLLELSRAQADRLALATRTLDIPGEVKRVVEKVRVHYPGHFYSVHSTARRPARHRRPRPYRTHPL